MPRHAAGSRGLLLLLLLAPTVAADGGSAEEAYPRNMITRKPAAGSSSRAAQEGGEAVSRWTVPCSSQYTEPGPDGSAARPHPGCTPSQCHRVVVDGFISRNEVAALLAIARKGFAFSNDAAAYGGPTIMDINSGYVRDQDGLINMYSPNGREQEQHGGGKRHDRAGAAPVRFAPEEYAL